MERKQNHFQYRFQYRIRYRINIILLSNLITMVAYGPIGSIYIERRIYHLHSNLEWVRELSCEPLYAHWSAMKHATAIQWHAAGTSPLERDEIAGGVKKI